MSVITRISLRMRLSSRCTPGGKLPTDAGVDEPPPPDGAATDVPGTPSKSFNGGSFVDPHFHREQKGRDDLY